MTRHLWMLALALALPGGAGAAPSPLAPGQDARLDHPLTLRVRKSPLSRVVAESARQAGARVTPPLAAAVIRRAGPSQPVREMADGQWPALARFAAALTREQWNALLDGRTLRFSTRDELGAGTLPSELARELGAAVPSMF